MNDTKTQTTPAPVAGSGMRWEYQTVGGGGPICFLWGLCSPPPDLNKLGADGWEVVDVDTPLLGWPTYTLKRRIPNAAVSDGGTPFAPRPGSEKSFHRLTIPSR